MSNNFKYWVSVFIGFLIVLIAYKYSASLFEGFGVADPFDPAITGNVAPTPAPAPAHGQSLRPSGVRPPSVPAPPPPPTILKIPNPDKLLMYFNSFNIENISNVPGQNNTYYCQQNKWCDAQKNIQYFLNGQNVPSVIDNGGLPLKNILIQGPPTYSLVSASNNYQLGSFSIIFYLNFNTLSFDTDAEIILYEMFAEYPNKIRISIVEIPDDPNNVDFNVIIGNALNIYTWKIPITTALSNGNTTVYSIVYDNDALMITLYIGVGANIYTTPIHNTSAPTIILGVTPLQINTNRNLDASILAFCYYNYALSKTDMVAVNDYFIQESSSTYLLESAYDALRASLSSQNSALINQLNNTTQTINGLQSKIDSMSCPAAASGPAQAPSGPRWHVKMNGSSSVNDSDLQQCSPLTLKEFDLTMPQLQIPNIQATAKKVTSVLAIPPTAPPPTPPTQTPPTLAPPAPPTIPSPGPPPGPAPAPGPSPR